MPAVGAGDADWREVFADPGLRMGALMQAAAALWSYRDFTRALRFGIHLGLSLRRIDVGSWSMMRSARLRCRCSARNQQIKRHLTPPNLIRPRARARSKAAAFD